MSNEILGRVLRRFLNGDDYWSTHWYQDGHAELTLAGRLDDLTEEELVAVRKAGGLDFWEQRAGGERPGPR